MYLQQPGVSVRPMTPWEKFIKVILRQNELDSSDIVRILFSFRENLLNLIIVQCHDCFENFPARCNKLF